MALLLMRSQIGSFGSMGNELCMDIMVLCFLFNFMVVCFIFDEMLIVLCALNGILHTTEVSTLTSIVTSQMILTTRTRSIHRDS